MRPDREKNSEKTCFSSRGHYLPPHLTVVPFARFGEELPGGREAVIGAGESYACGQIQAKASGRHGENQEFRRMPFLREG